MIHTYIPYCPKEQGQNLGYAYNTFMQMLPDNDWACFLDHDAMFTTKDWYHQLNEIINIQPNAGLFTCRTNRIGNPKQLVKNVNMHNHDIKYHRIVGKQMQDSFRHSLSEAIKPNLISGVVILIKKEVWKSVGGFKSGFLSVDNDIHEKCLNNNYKCYIMDGVYVYHWYRGDGDISHIKNKVKK